MPRKKKSDNEIPENGNGNGTYGDLEPEIVGAVASMTARSNELITELGRLELHKYRLVTEIQSLNGRATQLLRQEAERLEIPKDAPWKVTPEGQAVAVRE